MSFENFQKICLFISLLSFSACSQHELKEFDQELGGLPDYDEADMSECSSLIPEECLSSEVCELRQYTCDYVPSDMTFEEVCPEGGKFLKCVDLDFENDLPL